MTAVPGSDYDDFKGILERFETTNDTFSELQFKIASYFSGADGAPKEIYEIIMIKHSQEEQQQYADLRTKFVEYYNNILVPLLQQKEALLYIEQLSAASKTDCYISKIGLYKATGAKV